MSRFFNRGDSDYIVTDQYGHNWYGVQQGKFTSFRHGADGHNGAHIAKSEEYGSHTIVDSPAMAWFPDHSGGSYYEIASVHLDEEGYVSSGIFAGDFGGI